MTYPQMRTQQEIQKAHDILAAVGADPKLCAKIGGLNKGHVNLAGSVLCWALRHDRPGRDSAAQSFADMLAAFAELLEAEGEMVEDSGPYEAERKQ